MCYEIERDPKLVAITILTRYENEFGLQTERHSGFLTGGLHAMYLDPVYRRLMFVRVSATEEPHVFLDETIWCPIGILDETLNADSVIAELTKNLHKMTAYDFMMRVIVHVKTDEYEDWIVPKLLDESCNQTSSCSCRGGADCESEADQN